MTSTQTYLNGFQSFVPASDDNPDCVPFYRAWRGMETVIGKDAMNKWHHLLHEAIGWASYKPESEQYHTIVTHLRAMVDRWEAPKEPYHSFFYETKPTEPTEKDARDLFNREYKRAFPNKRANSKHANEQWRLKRDQAIAIVQEQYQDSLARYEKRKAEREQENARRKQDWIDTFHSMANFEEFVRNLETEAK